MTSIEDRLSHYMDLFKEAMTKVGDEQIALALFHELAKDARMAQIRAERQIDRSSFQGSVRKEQAPATVRQLALLRVLNVQVPEDLTKAQASRMIDDARVRDR